jgi:hypothetical protein
MIFHMLIGIAPASEAIVYEAHKFSLEDRIQERGAYSGKPRPELDQAWHDLLNGTYNGPCGKAHKPLDR